jgi:hypothetical protein
VAAFFSGSTFQLDAVDKFQNFVGLLHPHHRVGGRANITDDAITVDQHGCRALDEKALIEPVLLVHASCWVGQYRIGQVQQITIPLRLLHILPQDDQHLEVALFEIVVVPAQLGGMAAALQSGELTHEEQVDVLLRQEIFQRYLVPIHVRQGEIDGACTFRWLEQIRHNPSWYCQG